MAWTAPYTPVPGDMMTAAIWAPQVRDNFNELRAGGLAISGQAANRIPYSSSATQLATSAGLTFDGTTLTATAVTSAGTVTGLRGTFSGGSSRALTASTTFNGDYAADIHNLHATGYGLYIGVPATSPLALAIYTEVGGVASAGLLSLTGAGILTVNGFGGHNFTANGAGGNGLGIVNGTSGVGNYAYAQVIAGTVAGQITTYSQGFTTSGAAVQASTLISNDGAGGVGVQAQHASGVINFYTGGSATVAMRIHASRGVSIGNTTDPGVGSLFVNSQLYMLSGSKFYPDGGGDTYITESSANVVSIVAGGTTIIRNDGGGVKFPAQPGFFAYNSADDAGVTDGSTIDFDTEIYDETGNFAADTFTAPVTGRYLFTIAVHLNTGSVSSIRLINLVTSNRTYFIHQSPASSGEQHLSGSVIADLDAADTAYVIINLQSGGTVTVDGDGTAMNTSFSGRLLP